MLVLGAYGTTNLGDEAILESILNTLARSPVPVEVTVISTDEAVTTARYRVPAVFGGWRRQLLRKIRLFRSSDLLICGGGGLLQDTFPNRLIQGPAPRYSLLMLMARFLGCPVMAYAQGIGPLTTRYGRWISSMALRSATRVTVRDPGSAERVREITHGAVRPHTGADPAILLDPVSDAEAAAVLTRAGVAPRGQGTESRPTVAVCPRPWFHRKDIWAESERLSEHYLDRMCRLVSELGREIGGRTLLLPFDYSEDLPLCREIERRVGPIKNLRVVDAPLTPREMMGLLSAVDVLVGMRLHSLIFAARMAVPSVAIVYDPKVAAFMGQIGRPEASFPAGSFDAAAVGSCVRKALADRSSIVRMSEAARDRLVAGARSAEDLLLQLL